MYHQPSKRRLLAQRILVYTAMTFMTIGLVAVAIFVILGYQFNRHDGRIEQGGLVQFESRPAGATIAIDGAELGSQTSSKTTLSAGRHDIKIERAGYKSWQKTINVVPGTVLWLNYVRLIPAELTVNKVAGFKTISSTVASEDNKWMALKEDPAIPAIRLADVSGDEVKLSDITIPDGSYTHSSVGKGTSFSIEKWDPDNKFLLVKHIYDDTKIEWLVVNPGSPLDTKNVTTLLGINAAKLEFSQQNSAILYGLIDGTLRRIDLSAATLSGPLVANVGDFAMFESRLSFVTLPDQTTKARSVGYYDEGAAKPRIVKSYNDDGTPLLHAEAGKYFNENYLVVTYGHTITLFKGNLPRSDAADASSMQVNKTFTAPGDTRFLSIKTKGRFVMMQQADTYSMYDNELQKLTTTPIQGTSELSKELGWIDNYTPWSDRGGTIRLYEFDGANQQDIMPVTPGFSAALSPNGKYLYGIDKAADGTFELMRAQLILG